MEKFRKLGLSEELLKAIKEAEFENPSEIQEKTIPLILKGKDVIGQSATGSGKTLAFGAGIVNKVKKGGGIQALVLTPTRELAEQDSKSLKRFSKHYGLDIIEIYGGVAMSPQIENAIKADVVVGTPGRILDHLRQRTLDLKKVKVLVLDEADRMLDMGFIEDIQRIIEQCPRERQTLLFSATISPDIERIARHYMKEPVSVLVESYVDPGKLTQVYYDVPANMKFSLLVHLLKQEHPGLVMIFCNTRRNADFLARNLRRYDLDVMAIHGGLSQNKRSKTMGAFHSQKVSILVCTDVAARGLHIENVSHIYNYDFPKNSIDYIHRIGRTARAGKEGKAISLISNRDYENFRNVLMDEQLKVTKEDMPQFEEIRVDFAQERFRQSSRFGGRFSGQRFGGRRFGGERGRGRGFGGGGERFGGGRRFGGGGYGRGRSGEGRSYDNRRGGRRFGGRGGGRGRFSGQHSRSGFSRRG